MLWVGIEFERYQRAVLILLDVFSEKDGEQTVVVAVRLNAAKSVGEEGVGFELRK